MVYSKPTLDLKTQISLSIRIEKKIHPPNTNQNEAEMVALISNKVDSRAANTKKP